MRNINRNLCAMTAMLTLIAVSGCANQTNSTADTAETTSAVQEKASETTAADETDPAETDTKTETKPESAGTVAACSKADLRTEWDDDAVMLTCSGDSVTASASDGLTVEGGTVTITKGGDYVLSGKIKDGGIIVNLTDECAACVKSVIKEVKNVRATHLCEVECARTCLDVEYLISKRAVTKLVKQNA